MKENGLKTAIVMVIVLALGIMLGYYFGMTSVDREVTQTQTVEEQKDMETATEINGELESESSTKVNNGSVAESVPEEGIKVDTATLSEGQKKVLNTLGVDTENLVLTPEMVACAEAKIGSARLAEIQTGVSPSFLEGAALVACYK